jgi:hypothetical protein
MATRTSASQPPPAHTKIVILYIRNAAMGIGQVIGPICVRGPMTFEDKLRHKPEV